MELLYSHTSSSSFCLWGPRVALSGLAHWVLRGVKWHHGQSKAISLFETVETRMHLSKCGVMKHTFYVFFKLKNLRFHVICDCLDCKTAIRFQSVLS